MVVMILEWFQIVRLFIENQAGLNASEQVLGHRTGNPDQRVPLMFRIIFITLCQYPKGEYFLS